MDAGSISEKSPLYERLADEIGQQINQGTFRPGERIPSVRKLSQQRDLSVTTVLQAYQTLEDRGLIEARPQSGYFVRCRYDSPPPEASTKIPYNDPTEINITDLSLKILRDGLNPNLVQFGAANPDPDLLPTPRLNRIMAGIARSNDFPVGICGIPEGLEELRVLVAQRSFHQGAKITPDDIIITGGAMEAVSLALRTICQPGDLVAIESPTYFNILQSLENQGLQALEIPTHHQTGVSLEALRFAMDHHPIKACLFVTNFSNPMGSVMPDENKRELANLLAERQIPLIEDDVYGELFFTGTRPKTVKAYDRDGLVLLCSSFTKDVSPHYRIGWIAPGRYRKQVERQKHGLSLDTPVLSQLTIARFLASGGYDHHLRRIRRAYQQKVTQMAQSVLRYFPSGTRLTTPNGGFVLWVQLPEKADAMVLYQRALQAGITLAPGHIFSPTRRYQNFIRLNAAYWHPEADRSVARIAQLVERMLE